MVLVLMAMVLDVLVFINTIAHDVPSYILDRDVTTKLITYAATLLLCAQWFSQLLLLPVLSVIHFLAVFAPLRFRRISYRDALVCVAGILIVNLLMTAPLFTSYCGFAYSTNGHYWYFDFTKPYTYLYTDMNIGLQAFCVGLMLVIDVLIVYKVYKLQRKHSQIRNVSVTNMSSGNAAIKKKRSRLNPETRLALSFVVLTLCFLTTTLCFNMIRTNGLWQDAVMKLSSNINLFKWALYSLGNNTLRSHLRYMFKLQKPTESSQSLFTRTQM